MENKKKLFIIFTLLIIVVIGALSYAFIKKNELSGDKIPVDQPATENNNDYLIINGPVKEISSNNIVIEIPTAEIDENNQTIKIEKKFTINNDTLVFISTGKFKSQADFSKEENEYLAKVNADGDGKKLGEAPRADIVEKASLSDIKLNHHVSLYYQTGANYAFRIIIENLSDEIANVNDGNVVLKIMAGAIISVDRDKIKLGVTDPDAENMDKYSEEIFFSIDKNTEILKKIRKPSAEFEREQAEFINDFNTGDNQGKEAPLAYKYENIPMSGLKTGSSVTFYFVQEKDDNKLVERIEVNE